MDDDGSSSTKIRDLHVEPGDEIKDGDGDDKETVPWYQTQSLFYLILIIIIVVLLVVVLVLKRRRDKAKEEVAKSLGMGKDKRPTQKVEATTTGPSPYQDEEAAMKPGTMVKRPTTTTTTKVAGLDEAEIPTLDTEVAEIITPKKTKALPPQAISETSTGDIDGELPEVEVEYVPEVKAVVATGAETPTTTTGDGFDVHLPSADEEEEYEDYGDESVELPEPGSGPVEDSEFVPPEIDLSGIMEPEVEPAQPHRQEISEAKQRGAGIDFAFKKPDEKKKKRD
jgi:hypothetical protein